MLADGAFTVRTVSDSEAGEFLGAGGVANVANPTHGNSLDAISRKLGVDVRVAKGGRISLVAGDECLVAQISNIPRETREFSDEEIASARFEFRIVSVR